MQLATVVADRATGDRTPAVQATQRPSLRPARQACVASQVQLARCVQHDTVAYHDRMDVGVTGQLGEHPGRDLDGDRPFGDRARPVDGGIGVGVDHDHVLGSSRPGHPGGAVDECDQRVAGQELVFLDRILRTPLWHLVGEHRLDRRCQLRRQTYPGDRIEPPRRFHIPSPSTHDDARTLRRCRANRSNPSSAWTRFASNATRRANCSTVRRQPPPPTHRPARTIRHAAPPATGRQLG